MTLAGALSRWLRPHIPRQMSTVLVGATLRRLLFV